MAADRAGQLTDHERAVILVLMAEARPLSSADFADLGVAAPIGRVRRRLNDLGLVESDRTGRGYRHDLTDQGWAWCAAEMTAPASRGAIAAVLRGLGRHLQRAGLGLADVFRPDPEAEIRRAYRAACTAPGEWVRLAELRDRIPSVPREEVDAALARMSGSNGVSLAPEADQKSLTRRDRDAAARIGPKDVHLVAIGDPP